MKHQVQFELPPLEALSLTMGLDLKRRALHLEYSKKDALKQLGLEIGKHREFKQEGDKFTIAVHSFSEEQMARALALLRSLRLTNPVMAKEIYEVLFRDEPK